MLLTEQQIFDYMYCPALYEMKYIRRIQAEKPVSMNKLLNMVANCMYSCLLDGRAPTSHELKKRWDNICQQYSYYVDHKKALEGLGLVLKMYKWAADERLLIADVNTMYKFIIKDLEITGNIGVISVRKEGRKTIYENLITDFSSKLPDQTMIDMKFKYTLDAIGFQSVFNKQLDGIRIRNIKQARDLYTTRNKNSYPRVLTTIVNIAKAIENNIFYVKEIWTCNSCQYRDYCVAWA